MNKPRTAESQKPFFSTPLSLIHHSLAHFQLSFTVNLFTTKPFKFSFRFALLPLLHFISQYKKYPKDNSLKVKQNRNSSFVVLKGQKSSSKSKCVIKCVLKAMKSDKLSGGKTHFPSSAFPIFSLKRRSLLKSWIEQA